MSRIDSELLGRASTVEALEPRRLLAVGEAGAVTLDDIPDWAGRADGAAELNGAIYFARYQSDWSANVEIWKSDGTPAGTTRLATTNGDSGLATTTGAVPSVRDFVAAGDRLYFTVDNELWTSDGTAAGTKLWQSPYGLSFIDTAGAARKVVAVGDAAYVAAGGQRLYRIDASGSPPQSIYSSNTVTDLVLCGGAAYFVGGGALAKITGETSVSGLGVSGINSPIAVTGGRMYFSRLDPTSKTELWTSDGTVAGTVRLAVLPLYHYAAAPAELTGCAGAAYFVVDGALWRSDGTAAGTGAVLDINPNGSDDVAGLTAVGDTLYFRARDGANTTDLYRTDGTAAGTVRVTSIGLMPFDLAAGADGKLYFSALSLADGAGTELWTSDGTAAGTVRLTDLNPGLLSGIFGRPIPSAGGTVLFHGVDPLSGAGMFAYDATAPRGATSLCDYNHGVMNARVEHAASSDGSMYFAAPSGYSTNVELFRADGTPGGAKLVKEIYTNARYGSDPKQFYHVNGTMYFVAATLQNGRELWKSDGTAAGTAMVKDMSWRQSSTQISAMHASGNLLYFDASTYGSNSLPSGRYQTDGTDGGTVAAPNGPRPPSGTAGVSGLIATAPSGWTYYGDYDMFHLYLKRTKGSVTQTVGTWNYSYASASTRYPREISFVGDKIVFAASDNTYGAELWAYSETTGETSLLRNFIPERSGTPVFATSGDPEEFFVIGDWAYFVATDNEYGRELWRTDGTAAGTALFADLTAGSGSSWPYAMGTYAGKQLLLLSAPETGREWWVTDGTTEGTHVLVDINPGPTSADIRLALAAAIGDRLYFTANDSAHGHEVWTTDGTATGTFILADIAAGALGSNAMNFTNANGVLWFTANDGVTGVNWYRAGPPKVAMHSEYHLSDHWQVPLAPAVSETVPGQHTWEWDLDDDGVFGESDDGALGGDETRREDALFSSHHFTSGQHTIRLRVRDADGFTSTVSSTVRVNEIPGIATASGGHYTMTGPMGAQVVTVGGRVSIGSGANLGRVSLEIESTAAVVLTAPLRVAGLELANGASLDVGEHDLVIDYTDSPSPLGSWTGSSYTGVLGLIQSGRTANRTWDGPGIMTSMPDADAGLTGLGVGEAKALLGISGTETAVWNGHIVDATTVLVRYTYAGDANLDGQIDAGDYGIIDNFVQIDGANGYGNGDFNYDGFIDAGDYGIIDNNIRAQGAPLFSSLNDAKGAQPVSGEVMTVNHTYTGVFNDAIDDEEDEALVESAMEGGVAVASMGADLE